MTLEDRYDTYQRRWFVQTRFEHTFMIVLHAVINFLHCLPLWIVGSQIEAHSKNLQEKGFLPTKSEEEALVNVFILMAVSPIVVVVVVPLIQLGTLFLYYHYGHPWCRLFKHFKQSGEEKKTIGREKTFTEKGSVLT